MNLESVWFEDPKLLPKLTHRFLPLGKSTLKFNHVQARAMPLAFMQPRPKNLLLQYWYP